MKILETDRHILRTWENSDIEPDPIVLHFTREDANPCAEMVVFSSLNISKQLPLHQPVDIQLTLEKPGEYEFTCQMGMYRGKIFANY